MPGPSKTRERRRQIVGGLMAVMAERGYGGDVEMSPLAKLVLLASLYLSQGLPYGFFTQALPVLMRQQGLSLPQVTLGSLMAFPWALKFVWAPLVDRFHSARLGRRRSWILPLQAAAVLLLGAVACFDPREKIPLLLACVGLTNLVAATQDIATDGLAVDLLSPGERGLGNGVQVAAYRVGMIVGGGLLLVVFQRFGWTAAFLGMASVLALATIPIGIHAEPPPVQSDTKEGTSWSQFLGRRHVGAWLLVLALYKSGEAFAFGVVRPMLVDLGLTLEDIGWLLGSVGFSAGLAGAMLGGYVTGLVPRRLALLSFGALQALAVAGFVFPATGRGGWPALAAVCALEHLASGMATAALFTMMMDVCAPESAATDYTIQASLVVVATGGASAVSGFSAQALGYARHFGAAAALSAITLALVVRLLPPESTFLPKEKSR